MCPWKESEGNRARGSKTHSGSYRCGFVKSFFPISNNTSGTGKPDISSSNCLWNLKSVHLISKTTVLKQQPPIETTWSRSKFFPAQHLLSHCRLCKQFLYFMGHSSFHWEHYGSEMLGHLTLFTANQGRMVEEGTGATVPLSTFILLLIWHWL